MCSGCRKPILGLDFVYLVWNNILFVVPRNIAPPSELWFQIPMDSQTTIIDGVHRAPFCCLSTGEQAHVLVEVITHLAKTTEFSNAHIWLLPHSIHKTITSNQVEKFDGIVVSLKYKRHRVNLLATTFTCSQHE